MEPTYRCGARAPVASPLDSICQGSSHLFCLPRYQAKVVGCFDGMASVRQVCIANAEAVETSVPSRGHGCILDDKHPAQAASSHARTCHQPTPTASW